MVRRVRYGELGLSLRVGGSVSGSFDLAASCGSQGGTFLGSLFSF